MEILLNHLWDWLILIGILGGALYTLHIVRQESSDFIDESYDISFGNILLPVPTWWSITKQENTVIEFSRTDTRYDWMARFQFIADETHPALTDVLHAKIEREELDFDKDDVIIETEPTHLFKEEATQNYFPEVIRVEGKASQQIEERVYLDIYLFRNKTDRGYYICESRSSVLNGLVEGPFFEECISRLRINS